MPSIAVQSWRQSRTWPPSISSFKIVSHDSHFNTLVSLPMQWLRTPLSTLLQVWPRSKNSTLSSLSAPLYVYVRLA